MRVIVTEPFQESQVRRHAPVPVVPPRGVYWVKLPHTSADTIDFR